MNTRQCWYTLHPVSGYKCLHCCSSQAGVDIWDLMLSGTAAPRVVGPDCMSTGVIDNEERTTTRTMLPM